MAVDSIAKKCIKGIAGVAFGVVNAALRLGVRSYPSCVIPEGAQVLWIRPDGIGDFMMSLPALRMLTRARPDVKVDVLIRPHTIDLAEVVPGIRHVYSFERRSAVKTTRDRPSSAAEQAALFAELRARRYDLAIDIAGVNISRKMAVRSGAKISVTPMRSMYASPFEIDLPRIASYPLSVPQPVERGTVANNKALVAALGVPEEATDADAPTIPIPDAARNRVRGALAELSIAQSYVVLHANTAEAFKSLPTSVSARIVRHILGRFACPILLTGSKSDIPIVEEVMSACEGPHRLSSVAGMFNMVEFAALCDQAALVVTADTGPMHVAGAIGARIIALMPGNHRQYAPFVAGGRFNAFFSDNKAPLTTIPLGPVLESIDAALGSQTGSAQPAHV
jgi:ADP-heptose:LPS heptosyltransferase